MKKIKPNIEALLQNTRKTYDELFPPDCGKDRPYPGENLLGRKKRRIRKEEATFISR